MPFVLIHTEFPSGIALGRPSICCIRRFADKPAALAAAREQVLDHCGWEYECDMLGLFAEPEIGEYADLNLLEPEQIEAWEAERSFGCEFCDELPEDD